MALDFTGLKNIGNGTTAEGQEAKKDFATRKLEKQADIIEEAKKVYREHQEARKISQTLQWEIMKGVNNGEGIRDLFLKAVKTISLMTGTDVFYTQIERQIKEKY